MKNTGKRLATALVFAMLASLPFMAMAGQFWSQR